MSNSPTIQWGDPDIQREVPGGLIQLLEKRMKWKAGDPLPYPRPEFVKVPKSQMTDEERRQLSELIGIENVKDEHDERLRHSLGKSYLDIIEYCSGELSLACDAVLYPGTAEDVSSIIAWASQSKRKIIPFGGGTSVVGGVNPVGAALTLSMARMNKVQHIDLQAQTVRVEAGILGPKLEGELNTQGFTLGHFPQSFEYSTVGGWIAARSAGQQSTRYGKIEDLVVSLTVVTPAGRIETRTVPAESAGPDMDQIFCGSEGTLGVICDATLRIHRVPEERSWVVALVPEFEAGMEAVRELIQRGFHPATIRLSDAPETQFLRALSSEPSKGVTGHAAAMISRLYLRAKGITGKEGCLLLLGFEGESELVSHESLAATKCLRNAKATIVDSAIGEGWFEDRFKLPYLRDPLIQHGLLVDTFETAATWGKLFILYREVKEALDTALTFERRKPVTLAHLSHIYPEGASLYITVVAPARIDEKLQQWRDAQKAVMDVFMKQGAALSHHHGIGSYQSEFFKKQAGRLEMDVLRAVKASLDPESIMNPGKLGM